VTLPLRVAMAGSSGVGKTTLAKFISETYDVPCNPVGSRSVAAQMGFDVSPYDVDKAGRRAEFQARLLQEKVAWEQTQDSFVTDRTTADNLTYTALHDVHSITSATLERASMGLARYTHIFLCEMDSFFDPGSDSARVKDKSYHLVFEACLKGVLMAHTGASRPPLVFRVVRGSTLEERKAYVKRVIDNVRGDL